MANPDMSDHIELSIARLIPGPMVHDAHRITKSADISARLGTKLGCPIQAK